MAEASTLPVSTDAVVWANGVECGRVEWPAGEAAKIERIGRAEAAQAIYSERLETHRRAIRALVRAPRISTLLGRP